MIMFAGSTGQRSHTTEIIVFLEEKEEAMGKQRAARSVCPKLVLAKLNKMISLS